VTDLPDEVGDLSCLVSQDLGGFFYQHSLLELWFSFKPPPEAQGMLCGFSPSPTFPSLEPSFSSMRVEMESFLFFFSLKPFLPPFFSGWP